MPPFRDVEFPDLAGECHDDYLRVEDAGDGDVLVTSRDADNDVNTYNYLNPEQQDELWRRLGEARGHLPPATTKPQPWRDLPGGEG